MLASVLKPRIGNIVTERAVEQANKTLCQCKNTKAERKERNKAEAIRPTLLKQGTEHLSRAEGRLANIFDHHDPSEVSSSMTYNHWLLARGSVLGMTQLSQKDLSKRLVEA